MITPFETQPYLPYDCIYYILHYIKDCHQALFNCLLVDRFWCRTAVPLLYSNPFNKINKNNSSIILTLILCFNKTEIAQLKNQLKLINVDISKKINDEYKPLFEYIKYLEVYDHSKIDNTIYEWCRDYSYRYDDPHSKFLSIVHKSILYHCNNLKTLNISLITLSKYEKFDIQTFTSNLTRLNSLCLNGIDNEIAQKLANTCSNIRKLEISIVQRETTISTKTKEKLHEFIKKQENLQIFKITYSEYLLNNIFLPYSLVYIEFRDINFCRISFKNLLVNLHNLKDLMFHNCRKVLLYECENLKFSKFKLERLIIKNNTWDDSVTPLIIKYLGASLKELILIDTDVDVPIIDNISKCLELIILEIKINSYFKPKSYSYFKNLRIRTLKIVEDCCSSTNWDEKYMYIAKNLSVYVKEISIGFIFSSNSNYLLRFEKFLDNCHGSLEKINLNNSPYYDIDKFVKVVLNYIKRSDNSLKVLEIKLERLLKGKTSKLLDQIREKGIQIDINYKEDKDYDTSFYWIC